MPCAGTGSVVAQGQLVYRSENTWLVILNKKQSPEFQKVICLWAIGAHRLELFLFYRSQEHSNLNLNVNLALNSRCTYSGASLTGVILASQFSYYLYVKYGY